MIVSFAYPSPKQFSGGVVTLYEYANALARRGHTVHMIHGPAVVPNMITDVNEITWFDFDPRILHHVVDDLADPSLPVADVIFAGNAPPELGLPVVLIQGYKLIAAAVERGAYRIPCLKLCVASWLLEVGVRWGSPPEQMVHVPLGIDHQVFRPERSLDDRPVDVALLYSIHPVKGCDDAIEALDLVRRQHPNLRVEAFGIIRPDELPDWIGYHEDVSRPDLVRNVYGRAKIFVQPSRIEGFGLTAVEAMACGCALVSTDNGGSRDYAHHEETALVTPRSDPPALAAAIERLLDDDALRRRLAEAGERFVRRFDWDLAAREVERHLDAYVADPAAYRHPPRDAPLFLDDAALFLDAAD